MPSLRRPMPAPPYGQRWVLVPGPPVRTRRPKSKACVAHHEQHRQGERREAEQSVRHRCRMKREPDEDTHLLEWVYRQSLTTARTNEWWLRRKNAKALWIAIEQSECEAAEEARLAKLKRQQEREV
ncbi:Phosphorylated carbohydrates phosphatase [Hordeum vulgare]|nr:Phosphorylated carbohydrates phosphatase [Hordeum vulgare]